MEIAIIISSLFLVLFAVLALYDGFYLHIFKYQLHNRTESKTEHLAHTIRAVFFPAMLYFLFFKQDSHTSFFIGLTFVLFDILVLGYDAFVEKDSRQFMGGLPRWEYIVHLFVNGFHFASIAVYLSIRLTIQNGEIIISNINQSQISSLFNLLIINLLPAAIINGSEGFPLAGLRIKLL
ncbi:hypothetical protein [Flavobacterium lipolyticum]|uniref:Uncharacterized protein n=1 Tax=Flavobacterium lipolyticum TaxID=2893754 RepID=A0ABS8M6K4_9FLAO|nr:hypothetical protein [Flavobacterium sp. F-126]MCC9020458.1 hypothetical protein [Flavobacterium sp. F-126]